MPSRLAVGQCYKINLADLRAELEKHAAEWVAISEDNSVLAAGSTYTEAVQNAEGTGREFVVLKVPPLDATLAPHTR